MTGPDDDRFRVKPAPPRRGRGEQPDRFISSVLRQASKVGASGAGVRPASTFGRGRVASGLAGRGMSAGTRRVVVKSRYVVLKRAGARSLTTHLRYIERDGVTRDGQRGRAYGPTTDEADLKAFEERGRGDRHQFRFIVSVEDAERLEDLRAFARELMQRMSVDLETPLDWVAVDHWDTDNPHTHVVLRGRAANGQDLVIAPDYMAHGMRQRASALATEWLGPRTELEIRRGLEREVAQERLTSLDRSLLRHSVEGIVDLTETPRDARRQPLLRSRLQRLEAMELAQRLAPHRWRLAPDMSATLTALGERGDILRTMHKALKGLERDCAVPGATNAGPVAGRIVARGLDDEIKDRCYLVIDGIDGRAHYVRLAPGTDLPTLTLGGVAEFAHQGGASTVALHLPIERQVNWMGATWLDGQLAQGQREISGRGFGAEVIDAMHRRVDFLAEQGLAWRADGRLLLDRELLKKLGDRERSEVAARLERETGLVHRPLREGVPARGVYRRSIQLGTGRLAMLDDGVGFSLVPWKPALEKRMGQAVSAVVSGESVTWSFARQRGLSPGTL